MGAPDRFDHWFGMRHSGICSSCRESSPRALHIGNYFGAIRQYVALQEGNDAYYFVANYHALTSVRDAASSAATSSTCSSTCCPSASTPRRRPCSSSPTCPRRPSWPGS